MKQTLCLTLCFIFIFGNVFGIHQQNETPHLCEASGESSEECIKTSPYGMFDWLFDPKPTPSSDSVELNVRFFLHTNPKNPNSSVEIHPNFLSLRQAKPYPPSNSTMWKFLIPGFPLNGKSPFPANVLNAYMTRMRHNPKVKYNIVVVDWGQAACTSNTNYVNSTYTAQVGKQVAKLLLFLNVNNFATLREDMHVIGFSLGAHIAGEMARVIFTKYHKMNLLYRLTALDPTGEGFWTRGKWIESDPPSPVRPTSLRRSFISFVDVYHTSRAYGEQKHFGDIDFYPNGGLVQQGCSISSTAINNFEDLCSHLYATELFAYSITNKKLKGCTGCVYYDLYEKGDCDCEDEPVVGEFVDEIKYQGYPLASGSAFVQPGDLSNFGRHLKQRLENDQKLNGQSKWFQLCDVDFVV